MAATWQFVDEEKRAVGSDIGKRLENDLNNPKAGVMVSKSQAEIADNHVTLVSPKSSVMIWRATN